MNLFPLLVPAGNDTEVQFNDGQLFAGDSTFTFTKGTGTLVAGGMTVSPNSAVFQPTVDSTTFFQILKAIGGTPVFNVDTTNSLVEIETPLGPELVTNGGFGTDSDWIKGAGWTISAGEAHDTSTLNIRQDIDLTEGKVYRVTYDCTAYTSGGFSIQLDSGTRGLRRTATGSYSEDIIAGSNITNGISIDGDPGGGAFVGSIDNVSCKLINTAINLEGGQVVSGNSFFSGRLVLGESDEQERLIVQGDVRQFGTASQSILLTSGFNVIGTNNLDLTANLSSIILTSTNSFINYRAKHHFWRDQNNTTDWFRIHTNGNIGIAEEIPETLIEATGTAPYLTLHNSTHEDTDGGRESKILCKGEQSGGEETTLTGWRSEHDGAADDEKGKQVFSTNAGSDGDTPTDQLAILSTGDLVVNKTAGVGIKVDLAAPTFGFADLLGEVFARNTGASKPTRAVWKGGTFGFQFAAGKNEEFEFHIPHDYVPDTEIFLHVHWGHNGTLVTGGTVTFDYEMTYAKGHGQGVFGNNAVSTIVSATATTAQYSHELSEGSVSVSGGSGTQIDEDGIEPDGVIKATVGVNAVNLTVSGGGVPDPFIHYIDIHYQSTGITGTKAKAPNFYA